MQATATSLCDVTRRRLDLTAVLMAVLQRLADTWRWLESDCGSLLARWNQRSYLTGRMVRLVVGQESGEGLCRGIDEHGALLLETPRGTQRFQSGVVRTID